VNPQNASPLIGSNKLSIKNISLNSLQTNVVARTANFSLRAGSHIQPKELKPTNQEGPKKPNRDR